MVSCLNEGIEAIRRGHVGEVWASCCVKRPPLGEHDHLAELPARRVVIWPEGAVGVTGDSSMTGQVLHGGVEVVCGVYICEAERAGCRCAFGGDRDLCRD